MPLVRLLPLSGLVALLSCAAACGSRDGDEPVARKVPPPTGNGALIRDISNPTGPKKVPSGSTVAVTGAVVIAIDTFDETRNGRSAGTIYVADLGSDQPYSGISLYNPSFVPGNLRVGPGDTLDLRGVFQENNEVPVKFAPDAFLIQLATPVASLRFDAQVPQPVVINIDDLADYSKGRQWQNMLVKVENVKLQRDARRATSGRTSVGLLPDPPPPDASAGRVCLSGTPPPCCEDPFPKAPTLVNELSDLGPLEPRLKKDVVVKSITGIVTFFCNLHIAPRSPSDIEL